MWLTQTSIRRPLAVFMAILALVVLGYKSMRTMPVDLLPKTDIPYVSIITVYRGAGPREVETLLSKPIEEAVASINKVKNVTSTSQEGVSVVVIQFQTGSDLEVAASDVRDKLDTAKADLPDESEDPIVYKVDLGARPVIYLGMSSDKRSIAEVKRIADDIVKDRFGKVDGAASVSVSGGDTREIYVKVDQDRLKANGLNIMELTQAIAQGNLNIPAGSIKQGQREYSVRIVGEFDSPEQLQELKLKHSNPLGDNVVALSDVATVLDTYEERQQFTRLMGADSVGITITKQADANTVKVADGVKKEMEALKKILPPDVKIVIAMDTSDHIKQSLHDVTYHLFEGALLATIVVFIFLHVFRATFIILLAIPTSIMATFLPISSFGFSLNVMTMMGLAMCVGILVDDSIVVLENIFRHLTMGEKPEDAALNGRMEIGGAAVAITMTDIVVFVPIAFMGGIVGMFFKQFGITIATATLFSLFISFTLTPMLASRWLKAEDALIAEGHGKNKGVFAWFARVFDNGYNKISDTYKGFLKWSLRHRFIVIIVGNLLLVAVVFFVTPKLGFEFFPRADENQVTVNIEMPVGTRVEETSRVTSKIEGYVLNKKKYPEVDSVFTNVGSTETNFGVGDTGPRFAQITVHLYKKNERLKKWDEIVGKDSKGKKGVPVRGRSIWDLQDDLAKDAANVPGPEVTMSTSSMGGRGGAPLSIELTGSNTQEILDYAEKVEKIVRKTEGTKDVDISWKQGQPEIQVSVDRLKASQFGLSVAAIAMTLRNSVEGDTTSKFREKETGDEYDIRIRLEKANRRSMEDIKNIMLAGAMGRNILLKDVAEVKLSEGPSLLERKNRQRLITVSSDLAQGYKLGNVMNEIKQKLNETSKPESVNYFFGGEAEDMMESFQYMVSALFLAVLLVYMLMVALYESFLYPFIIMFSLPQALVGALLALFLANKTLSIVSMIGVIMLIGLVTKNAILLVDYTNTLRKRGMARNDALIDAGPTRLRPILMTTLTVVLGNMPIALGLGAGAEQRAPMSVAVIGGLIVSLLLTLIIIPCTYAIMDDFSNWLGGEIGGGKKKQDLPLQPMDPPSNPMQV